ncbi:MAG: HIT family protein [Sulfuriflexus sp.]|nr:HIT family protein [Sulfuriflexus sp.]
MADLHPQLEKDCVVLGQFLLSKLLLIRDANYPWLILVPDREAVTEIFQLDEADQQQLQRESNCIAQLLVKEFNADKINIAALGNVVPQLHIHHVARYVDDIAWPAPVWGAHPAKPYSEDELEKMIARVKRALAEQFDFLPS